MLVDIHRPGVQPPYDYQSSTATMVQTQIPQRTNHINTNSSPPQFSSSSIRSVPTTSGSTTTTNTQTTNTSSLAAHTNSSVVSGITAGASLTSPTQQQFA